MHQNAEAAVLSCCLQYEEAATHVVNCLQIKDFQAERHRLIYAAIYRLKANSTAIDLITVTEELTKTGELEKVGGALYLAQLAQDFAPVSNIEHYCRLVKEKSRRKQLEIAAKKAINALAEGQDCTEIQAQLQQDISNVAMTITPKPYHTIADVIANYHINYDKKAIGISWGYSDLDRLVGLLQPKLYILAARPAMGKTALALSISLNLARKGYPVYIASMEMDKERIAQRLLAAEALIDSKYIYQKNIPPEQMERLIKASSRLAHMPLVIDDSPLTTGLLRIRATSYQEEMVAKAKEWEDSENSTYNLLAERVQAVNGLGAIVIDYLQYFQDPWPSHINSSQYIGILTKNLVRMAKELAVPIICLCQLNRDVEKRADKRPCLSDLRESGAIEQDADVVMMLYRDEYYNPDTDDRGMAELIITKNRDGNTGTVKLVYLGSYTRFAALERRE